MPGVTIRIILDSVYNKSVPKPINLRPGYDMKHVNNYLPQTDNFRFENVQFSKKVMRITKNVINKKLVIKIISNFANLLLNK